MCAKLGDRVLEVSKLDRSKYQEWERLGYTIKVYVTRLTN
jgi:hypothetical protein